MKKITNYLILGFIFLFWNGALSDTLSNEELFKNKNILILGGTGYLGRAIATEVLKYNPSSVYIFSRDEVKQFNTINFFINNPKIHCILGDVRDYSSLLKATKSIDIVFHVAALKRMDALEVNVEESIKTNVIGSLNVFNACIANHVGQVLFISTDKACYPVNTYGACKFVSEKIFTNYDRNKIDTRFMVARFGNILESTGSVIPIFSDKINKGQEITLTDERMTRFIIGHKEATELLFDALRYGNGGEIFVKKLHAMKITDLISVMLDTMHATNPIKIIGLRPGEKIHEVLINESEMARAYEFKDFFVIRPSVVDQFFNELPDVPQYIVRGKRIVFDEIKQYSSDLAVLAKDDLARLFEKLNMF